MDPWPAQLCWLERRPITERSLVRFLVGAHAGCGRFPAAARVGGS